MYHIIAAWFCTEPLESVAQGSKTTEDSHANHNWMNKIKQTQLGLWKPTNLYITIGTTVAIQTGILVYYTIFTSTYIYIPYQPVISISNCYYIQCIYILKNEIGRSSWGRWPYILFIRALQRPAGATRGIAQPTCPLHAQWAVSGLLWTMNHEPFNQQNEPIIPSPKISVLECRCQPFQVWRDIAMSRNVAGQTSGEEPWDRCHGSFSKTSCWIPGGSRSACGNESWCSQIWEQDFFCFW